MPSLAILRRAVGTPVGTSLLGQQPTRGRGRAQNQQKNPLLKACDASGVGFQYPRKGSNNEPDSLEMHPLGENVGTPVGTEATITNSALDELLAIASKLPRAALADLLAVAKGLERSAPN